MTKLYPVNEIFDSIQGEGFWTGIPATFIRFHGCNLRCLWCDTKETWSGRAEHLTTAQILAMVHFEHVVITGGEPLLYDLTGLLNQLHQSGNKIHIETNGTQPWSHQYPADIWLTVSPKMSSGYMVAPSLHERVNEYKFVVDEDFDPGIMLAHPFAGSGLIFLSPENVRPEMVKKALLIVYEYPFSRLMVQIHKLIGIK